MTTMNQALIDMNLRKPPYPLKMEAVTVILMKSFTNLVFAYLWNVVGLLRYLSIRRSL